MKLHVLQRRHPPRPRDNGTMSPHILHAIDTLQAIWSGQFDDDDSVEALRRTAERLVTLAWANEADNDARRKRPDNITLCPRCKAAIANSLCPECHWHYGDGTNG